MCGRQRMSRFGGLRGWSGLLLLLLVWCALTAVVVVNGMPCTFKLYEPNSEVLNKFKEWPLRPTPNSARSASPDDENGGKTWTITSDTFFQINLGGGRDGHLLYAGGEWFPTGFSGSLATGM